MEKRRETCTVASKLVSIKIFRKPASDGGEGEITGFECDSSSQTCEGRCLYRQLLEDY